MACPVAGAAQRYQTERFGARLLRCCGSPDSAVAPSLEPEIEFVGPGRNCAATKLSLKGAKVAAGRAAGAGGGAGGGGGGGPGGGGGALAGGGGAGGRAGGRGGGGRGGGRCRCDGEQGSERDGVAGGRHGGSFRWGIGPTDRPPNGSSPPEHALLRNGTEAAQATPRELSNYGR